MLTVSAPVTARAPVQAPVAVQAVAFALDQTKLDEPPLATLLGLALKDTVGAGVTWLTFTVVDFVLDPPVPVQVSV